MTAPHRIRRQLWRIRASSPADAFVLRREVRAAWDAVLLPALESAFDAAAGDDRVIRIPRLELRLRLGNAEELAVELPRLIRDAAVAELSLVRADGPAQPWETPAAALSPTDDAGATLLHYLSTGALPWAASAPTRETAAMLRGVARLEGARLVGRIMAAPQPRAFAFRLLQLINEDDVPGWTAALPSQVPPFWRRVFVRLLAPSAAPEPVARDSIADYATSDSAASRTGKTDPVGARRGRPLAPTAPPSPRWSPPPRHARLEAAALLLVEALARTVDDTPQAVAAAATEARHGGAGNPSAPLIASLPEVEAAREDTTRAAPPIAPPKPQPSASVSEPTPTDAAEPIAREHSSRPSAPTDEFGIAIGNAGLILLLPFIAPLLEHRAVREGDTIPAHALPRAAALLHYLATGSDEVMEWELALVKVLLGLTPDDPLSVADGCLTTEDRDECEHLLRSAVAHWSALRDASTEAVRATFLQRPGLLRRDAQGWTLRVEPAPFDILLAQLPWSISVARLPWMTHPIYTEWTP